MCASGFFRVLLIHLLALGGLAACSFAPWRAEEHLLAAVPAAPLAAARAAERAGDALAAAEQYLALAAQASAPARAQLELDAVTVLINAGQMARAGAIFAALDRTHLTHTQRQQAGMLAAELALYDGRGADAIAVLAPLNTAALPAAWHVRRLALLAAAHWLEDDPLATAAALEQWGPRADETTRAWPVAVLLTLTAFAPDRLRAAATACREESLCAWLELAALLAEHGSDETAGVSAYQHWHRAHPRHPATPAIIAAYFAARAGTAAPGTRLALWLPRTGTFAAAAAAVERGFRAAQAADRAGAEVQVLNSATATYPDALATGAQTIVGPLEKAAVDTLAARSALPRPTLALNRAGDPRIPPAQLVSFALAPEDEIESIVAYAWAAGRRAALFAYPPGPWALRLAQAFRDRWQARGGSMAGEEMYGTRTSGFGAALGALLAPARGDFVVVLATPNDIGELWSTLQRLNGRGLPVVTTSHVYDGQINPRRDAALAGLYFVEIPWLLEHSSRSAHPTSGELVRLYALGLDAYRLAPHFVTMCDHPGLLFAGATGILRCAVRGQFHRRLALAQFTPSGPVRRTRIE